MALALALAAAGAALKLSGSLWGSRAALVDGLSCAANLAAGWAVYSSLRSASRPPDEDHPYGHDRLVYRGVIFTLIAYSFVAGFGAAVLYYSVRLGYEVEPGATALVAAGTVAYALAALAARSAGYAGAAYAGLTLSEVLEGIVTTLSAAGGATISYLVDAVGGAIILSYLVLETVREAHRLSMLVSDYQPPEVAREVRRLLEERGLKVLSLRLRTVVPGRYHGDAIVDPGNMPYEVADLLADEAAHIAREKHNVDLVVHVEASRR